MQNKMMVPFIIGVIVILGGGYLVMSINNKSKTENNMAVVPTVVTDTITPADLLSPTIELSPAISKLMNNNTDDAVTALTKTFPIVADNFSFSLKEIKVKKGTKVKIALTNNNGHHDWVIDEFNARTKKIGAGETDTVEFIADKTGTFEYYCSVGSHRAQGMKGNLIVD